MKLENDTKSQSAELSMPSAENLHSQGFQAGYLAGIKQVNSLEGMVISLMPYVCTIDSF